MRAVHAASLGRRDVNRTSPSASECAHHALPRAPGTGPVHGLGRGSVVYTIINGMLHLVSLTLFGLQPFASRQSLASAISPSMPSVPVVTASSSACPPTVRHPLPATFSRRSPDFLCSRCSALALRRTAALQPDRMPARAVHRQRSLSRGVLRSLRTTGGAVPRCGVRAARLSSCAWSRGNAWGVRRASSLVPGAVVVLFARSRCPTLYIKVLDNV